MAVIVLCQWQSRFAAAFFIKLSECANLKVGGAFVKFHKASSYLCVSPLAWNSSALVGEIFMKVDI
jgi:hypothetical protein